MRLVPTLSLVLVLLVACGPATGPTATLRGIAVAGPTCPVVTDPPDPGCQDRPIGGARVLVTDASGSEVASAVTDEDGRFSVELPPGTYRLVPQPVTGLMGTAAPVTVRVIHGAAMVPITLAYDTGIR